MSVLDNWGGLWSFTPPTKPPEGLVAFVLACCFILFLALVGVWDASVAFGLADDLTVSDVIRGWCRRWPLFPLAIGIVLGHIFAP